EKNYKALDGTTISRDYIMEAALGVELIRYATGFTTLQEKLEAKAPQAEINELVARLEKAAPAFFKDYSAATDKKVFAALMGMYYNNIDAKLQPEALQAAGKQYKGDFSKLAEEIYSKSLFT